jgi:E3 ubiquitin-protein ligase HERC4
MQPSLGKSLQELLDYQEENFEEMFALNFQITRRYFGEVQTVDLVPDGANKPVTKANRQDYVEAYVDYLLNKSVANQFTAFYHGFKIVCNSSVLPLIHPAELQAIVSGCIISDLRPLEEVTEYRNGYYREHCTISNFWNIIHEMGENLKKKFMIFLTGSERIPVTGLSSMKVYIQKCDTGLQNDRLPVAHTCFNILDLPAYSDRMVLRDKLIMAITQTEGFGLV